MDARSAHSALELLLDAQVPVEMAALAHDRDVDRWRLLVATRLLSEEGRTSAYRLIRDALRQGDLEDVLGDIIVVSPDHEAAKDLQALAAQQIDGSAPISALALSGFNPDFDDGRLFAVDPLEFERDLTRAVQGLAPRKAVMRTNLELIDPDGGRGEVDIWLDDGQHPVAIEAKATRRPLDASVIRRTLGRVPPFAQLIVVSRAGFGAAARAEAESTDRVRLVQWRSADDNEELKAALTWVFGAAN